MTTEPETISQGTEYDDDISKINVDGLSREMIMEKLLITGKQWMECEQKYKNCEKEFKVIKAWMIANNEKILITEIGGVTLKMRYAKRVIFSDIPEIIKAKYRQNVGTWTLLKLFSS